MAEVTINYKDAAIATMDASGTKTLQTQGKYCEDNIEVVYARPSGGGSGNLLLIASTAFHVATEVPTGTDTVNYVCDDNLYDALLNDFNSLDNEYKNMYLPIITYNGAELGGFVAGFEPVRLGVSGNNITVQYQSTYHRYFKAVSPGFGETSGSGMAFGYATVNQTNFTINSTETYVSIKTRGAAALKVGDYSVSVFRINAPNLGNV